MSGESGKGESPDVQRHVRIHTAVARGTALDDPTEARLAVILARERIKDQRRVAPGYVILVLLVGVGIYFAVQDRAALTTWLVGVLLWGLFLSLTAWEVSRCYRAKRAEQLNLVLAAEAPPDELVEVELEDDVTPSGVLIAEVILGVFLVALVAAMFLELVPTTGGSVTARVSVALLGTWGAFHAVRQGISLYKANRRTHGGD